MPDDAPPPPAPLFSVVIPAHNRGALLRRALESLEAQSFDAFEVIVVDDGSSEDLRPVVADSAARGLAVRLLHTGGKGANTARNMGSDAARGRYVCYLDSDDVFLPQKLTCTAEWIGARDPAIVVSPGYVWRGDDRLYVKPARPPRADEDISDYYFVADQRFITSTFVIRRDAAVAVRWDERLRKVQDPDFMIRLVRAGHAIEFHPDNQTVLFDDVQDGRISNVARERNMRDWLDNGDEVLTKRARAGFEAYALAYEVSLRDRPAAARLILRHALGGVPPRLAIKSLVRVIVPESLFKRMAQASLRLRRRGGSVDAEQARVVSHLRAIRTA